ncbi:Zinc finger C2H2-type/integrase DNA-binding domain [Phytophthora cactorum]|nr:Zinc finger C2H2-type/integrase DNA-binding domain [Phytophthora cactorum]
MMHVESVTKYSYNGKFDPSVDATASPSSTSSPSPPPTPKKPHKCPKRFSTSGNLSRHKRLHGVIKPLECPVEGCYCTFPSDNKLDKQCNSTSAAPCTTITRTRRYVRFRQERNAPLMIQSPMPVQHSTFAYPRSNRYSSTPWTWRTVSEPARRPDEADDGRRPAILRSGRSAAILRQRRDPMERRVYPTTPVQVVPSQLPSPIGPTPRGTRNPGIADVLSSIFDDIEYASADPEKPLPAPPLQPQNLLDDMVNFHVAHIEL